MYFTDTQYKFSWPFTIKNKLVYQVLLWSSLWSLNQNNGGSLTGRVQNKMSLFGELLKVALESIAEGMCDAITVFFDDAWQSMDCRRVPSDFDPSV